MIRMVNRREFVVKQNLSTSILVETAWVADRMMIDLISNCNNTHKKSSMHSIIQEQICRVERPVTSHVFSV